MNTILFILFGSLSRVMIIHNQLKLILSWYLFYKKSNTNVSWFVYLLYFFVVPLYLFSSMVIMLTLHFGNKSSPSSGIFIEKSIIITKLDENKYSLYGVLSRLLLVQLSLVTTNLIWWYNRILKRNMSYTYSISFSVLYYL